jgi:hypothetical protein
MAMTTLYTSRRVLLPPAVAVAAFDAVRIANAERTEAATWTVVAPSAVLVAQTADVPAGRSPLPRRHAAGRLRGRSGLGSFPVEVELTAWSHRHSEVGVRPCGRWVRLDDTRRQRRFCGLADEIASHLATGLEAVVGAWEGDVVAGAASFVETTNALRDLARLAHPSSRPSMPGPAPD